MQFWWDGNFTQKVDGGRDKDRVVGWGVAGITYPVRKPSLLLRAISLLSVLI